MLCAKCFTGPAKHDVWQKFDNPRPWSHAVKDAARRAGVDLPDAPKGVWIRVCDDCWEPEVDPAEYRGADYGVD